MKNVVTAVTLAAFTGACATAPSGISAQYVSPLQYQSYTCDQLALENQRISARVSEVTGQQQAKANSDAWAFGVGMVLFWPALFFMANGEDKKAELSRLKGEYDALQQVAISKDCIRQGSAQQTVTGAPAGAPAGWTPSPTTAN